jgi:hypothetical protein
VPEVKTEDRVVLKDFTSDLELARELKPGNCGAEAQGRDGVAASGGTPRPHSIATLPSIPPAHKGKSSFARCGSRCSSCYIPFLDTLLFPRRPPSSFAQPDAFLRSRRLPRLPPHELIASTHDHTIHLACAPLCPCEPNSCTEPSLAVNFPFSQQPCCSERPDLRAGAQRGTYIRASPAGHGGRARMAFSSTNSSCECSPLVVHG